MKAARLAWLALLAATAVWLVATRWADMADLVADARPLALLGVLAASTLLLIPNAVFWSTALRSLGENVGTGPVLHAASRTLMARYLPGGVWYAAGRSVLLVGRGVRPTALVAVSGLELGLGAPTALVVGGLLLAGDSALPAWVPWAGAGVLAAATLVARPVLNRLMGWWSRRRGQATPRALTTGALASLVSVMAAYWLLMGAVFRSYLGAMGTDIGWAEGSGAFLVSWGIGFFAIFAPLGLGVSEAGFIAIVGWGADAVVLLAGFRLVLLVRDLGLTAIGEALARRR
ncbi:MAG: hypothetical protein V1249_10790 [Acidimicrobiales bacterium]|nr:hypothetical protein [Acidimicrobiales bacterium]